MESRNERRAARSGLPRFAPTACLLSAIITRVPACLRAGRRSNSGIGISNVRTRLQSLYGDAFELSMKNQDPSGVEVSVSVPFKE